MSQDTYPDGNAVTSFVYCTFGNWVTEGDFSKVDGLKDSFGMVDGPDGRGYATSVPARQTLKLNTPSHVDTAKNMHRWKKAVEDGLPGARCSGAIQFCGVDKKPVVVYELQDCQCFEIESNDADKRSGNVHEETFHVSYSRLNRL